MYVYAPCCRRKGILFVVMEHIVALQGWHIEEIVVQSFDSLRKCKLDQFK
jgi:hypothetical protein